MRTILLFCVLLFCAACSRKTEDPAPTPGGGPVAPPVFDLSLSGTQGVQMTVDGQVVTLTHADDMIPYFDLGGEENELPQPSHRYYVAGIYSGNSEASVFQVGLGALTYFGAVDPEAFDAYFATGTRIYGAAYSPGQQRVEITYRDPTGIEWSTNSGSAQQNASSFNITQVQAGQDELGSWVKVVAGFNCTFYNAGGASMTVTNGGMMFEFRNF